MNKKIIKRLYNAFVIIIILLGVAYVCGKFVHLGSVEYTDNAQVYRHITPINTRVQGFIKEIRFNDYQEVHRGDTLIIIEDAEFQLRLAQAEAGVQSSQSGGEIVSASITTTESNIAVALAGIDEARVELNNARTDYERYEKLLHKEAVTRQQYDNAKARYEAAKARYERAANQRQSTALMKEERQRQLSQSHAAVNAAQSAKDLASLNLSYTVIVATCDGKMGKKQICEGQLVQPGQTLAEIVESESVWVIANYKERQMQHIAVGSKVEFTADAIPNATYKGEVEIIAGATGAAFSKVPTDNATGNFVKVQQRVPVKIRLTDDNDAEAVEQLLAGLNVCCKVSY